MRTPSEFRHGYGTLNPDRTQRVVRWLHGFEDGLVAAVFLAMLGIALYQIVGRNLLGTALLWGDSAVRYLVLWLTFLGALTATRSGEHIRIDVLARFLPPRALAVGTRLAALGSAFVVGLFAWHSARFVLDEYAYGGVAFGAVPVWIAAGVMPVSAALMTLRFLVHAVVPPRPTIS